MIDVNTVRSTVEINTRTIGHGPRVITITSFDFSVLSQLGLSGLAHGRQDCWWGIDIIPSRALSRLIFTSEGLFEFRNWDSF